MSSTVNFIKLFSVRTMKPNDKPRLRREFVHSTACTVMQPDKIAPNWRKWGSSSSSATSSLVSLSPRSPLIGPARRLAVANFLSLESYSSSSKHRNRFLSQPPPVDRSSG